MFLKCGKLKKLEASEIGNIMKEATSGGSKLQRTNTADSMESKTRSENADTDDVDDEVKKKKNNVKLFNFGSKSSKNVFVCLFELS